MTAWEWVSIVVITVGTAAAWKAVFATSAAWALLAAPLTVVAALFLVAAMFELRRRA